MLKKLSPYLSLFASLSTLICCAIPALLVTLGLGASLASAISAFPELVWFSENKGLVFGFSGIMIGAALFMRRYASELSCPTDPELAKACQRSRQVSGVILYLSLGLYLIGGFFAFVAPYLL